IIADAGYESSENYLYLEENGQECFIKPTNYEISKKRTYKINPYSVENPDVTRLLGFFVPILEV
ncbi:MAG: IS5/IS1182 family transposase, partial [Clostridia bacterium]|nr:IS5/IS1182 family transposase [Clostridia bacterium]